VTNSSDTPSNDWNTRRRYRSNRRERSTLVGCHGRGAQTAQSTPADTTNVSFIELDLEVVDARQQVGKPDAVDPAAGFVEASQLVRSVVVRAACEGAEEGGRPTAVGLGVAEVGFEDVAWRFRPTTSKCSV
jgi:hypothetical protein